MTATYGKQWRDLRRQWEHRLPVPCSRCGDPVEPWMQWDLDHAGLDRVLGGGHHGAHPAHAACNRTAGAQLGAQLQRIGAEVMRNGKLHDDDARFLVGADAQNTPRITGATPPGLEGARIGPDAADPSWDSLTWLGGLRSVPAGASWPRWMTAPHPAAVGSYGAEFIAWCESVAGVRLRWWQRLASMRVLEHDAAGELVWLVWLVSTPRQVGKSWWLRCLFLWRIHQSARFGETQLVLHTGKDLPVCREVQRPARAWARRTPGYHVRETNGQEEIEAPDGSRWIVRGRDSVYGYAVSLGGVDEAWKVDPSVVEDGLEPTMPEMASPQLGLVSTAHRLATPLMPGRRAGALSQLLEPTDTLLVEWSAPADADLSDRDTWHAASPHNTVKRTRLLESKYARALAGGASDDPDEPDPVEAFRSQWLNVWPDRVAPHSTRDEPLLEGMAWADAVDLVAAPVGPVTIAVEDFFGRGAAAAVAGITGDGRTVVWGQTFDRRADAFGWASLIASQRPGSRLLVGASLIADPLCVSVAAVSVDPAGQVETRRGLPMLRELLATGALVHDGGTDLTAQVASLWVAPSSSGGLLPSTRSGRSDLVRCAAWCVGSVAALVDAPALDFFVY